MEYSIQALSKMAGVSTRTLRYYDEIKLLSPARINSSGYRIYGPKEVDQLQMILFYRALDFELSAIGQLLHQPNFNAIEALRDHKTKLLQKQAQLSQLIETIDDTIGVKEGRNTMKDSDKFKAFKENMINNNEAQYGTEIREKYGEDAVQASNQKVMQMTEDQHRAQEALQEAFFKELLQAFEEQSPEGLHGQKAAALHKEWLSAYWPKYSKEAHYGLAQMYVDDERFKAHYDSRQEGLAVFLKEVIGIYTDNR